MFALFTLQATIKKSPSLLDALSINHEMGDIINDHHWLSMKYKFVIYIAGYHYLLFLGHQILRNL